MTDATLSQAAVTNLRGIAAWEGTRPSRELVMWVFALITAGVLIDGDAARPAGRGEVVIKESALDSVAEEACAGIVDCWRFSDGTDPNETIDARTFSALVSVALGVVFEPRLLKDRSLSNLERVFEHRWGAVWRGYGESERRMFLLVTDRILDSISIPA